MSYCFGNSEYDKKYGTLRNVIPYTARVKQYGKHMTTPQIGCRLGCIELKYGLILLKCS